MPVLTRKNSTEKPVTRKNERRGVTAMEYLMMISLILVVCLITIGYLGGTNNTSMSSSASSINKSLKKGS
jgi:uncharacterized protein (UPF0333 family)